MDILYIMESSNFAARLSQILKEKGIETEIISIPCKIAKDGCGHCLEAEDIYMDQIIEEAKNNKLIIKEIYQVTGDYHKLFYKKV